MNIIVCVAWGEAPPSPGWYLTKAFRRLGHKVTVVGPAAQVNTRNIDPYNSHVGNIIQRENIQLVVEVDSGGFDLNWMPTNTLRRGSNAKFVYWGSDTHISTQIADFYHQKKNRYDYYYFAQRRFLREKGLSVEHWLPHACDPDFHRADGLEKKYDVTFIGHQHPVHKNRIRLFAKLKSEKGLRLNIRGGIYKERLGIEYGSAHIALNCSLNGDLNMRFFEGMCSGSIMLTDWSDDAAFEELGFKRGEHFCAYDNIDRAPGAIRGLLKDHEKRDRVAATGQEYVCDKHTYIDRAKKILEKIK